MRYVFLSLCLLMLLSCRESVPAVAIHHMNGYTITDTLLPGPARYIDYDMEAAYAICYIGPAKGNVATGRPFHRINIRDTTTGMAVRKFDSSYLTLRVDTSATQLQIDRYHYDSATQARIIDSTSVFHAMRLTLENTSDTLLYLGNHDILMYVWLEMQNGGSEWIRLEKPSVCQWYCGTGASHNYLKPGEILIAKFPKFEGEFTANYRLVWQIPRQPKIISNEFTAPVSRLMLQVMELQTESTLYRED